MKLCDVPVGQTAVKTTQPHSPFAVLEQTPGNAGPTSHLTRIKFVCSGYDGSYSGETEVELDPLKQASSRERLDKDDILSQ